jgi:hypothetical protein
VKPEAEDVMNYQTSAEPDPGTQAGGAQSSGAGQMSVEDVAARAQEAAGQVEVKARDQIDQRTTQMGEQVSATAQALRAGADELVRQGNHSAADAAQRAASQAERLGSYLQDADADRLLADVENVARRNPWTVVVGGVVVGAAAARFLKASSARRYEVSRTGSNGSAYGSAYGSGSSYGSTYGSTYGGAR